MKGNGRPLERPPASSQNTIPDPPVLIVRVALEGVPEIELHSHSLEDERRLLLWLRRSPWTRAALGRVLDELDAIDEAAA